MEWPTSSFPTPQEDTTHPGRLPIGQYLLPRPPAVSRIASILANYPYGTFTSIAAGLPRSIEPHVWTVNPTEGLSSDRNILSQNGVAQTAQAPFAYREIPAESLDLLYASTSSGQPRRHWTDTKADTNPTWVAPNSATSRRQHPASESPPAFECKWRGCSSSTRFSTEGDLVRHLKSIHISPDAYSCSVCGKTFGRRDHLRDHQRRRHRGLA
ncbi:alpha/beta hydrolase family protein [Aspergillus niger]|uniref:C2H2-type zinc finger protein n=1 Tax=Aspergillus lacticoffeatus (strain CBS 101883) TaxID=1450533 RepID=UPI000D7F669C|nr:uncharacterized protein BO96DRAFT_482175 [Aspergillus niger CBS 101883]PYH53485.1 hypothetical protein BO96DRAFT_482175 [Aspergillus niger CBS 101883]GJP92146.1 alpha/beta hydrolase family protein [Aspergillus niger]